MDQKKEAHMQTNSQKSGGYGNKKCTSITMPRELPIQRTALLNFYMLSADVALLEKSLENTKRQMRLLQIENYELKLEEISQSLDRQKARVAVMKKVFEKYSNYL